VQTFPMRNLSPLSPHEQAASCAQCKALEEHLAFLGKWIKETENPKLRKQLEKTIEAVKGTAALHRLEQHSSLQMPHPVRSGLGQNYSRARVHTFGRDKAVMADKRER
jgi:hypothetical protein